VEYSAVSVSQPIGRKGEQRCRFVGNEKMGRNASSSQDVSNYNGNWRAEG